MSITRFVSLAFLAVIGAIGGGIIASVMMMVVFPGGIVDKGSTPTSFQSALLVMVSVIQIAGLFAGGIGLPWFVDTLTKRWHRYRAAHPPKGNDFVMVNGWPRFSLRAFFFGVVILGLVFAVGRQLYWKYQRERELSSISISIFPDRNAPIIQYDWGGGVHAPLLLMLLGDHGVCHMLLNERASDAELSRMRRLFPEAEIYRPQDIPTDSSYWTATAMSLEAGRPPGTGHWTYRDHQWIKMPDPSKETDSPEEQSPPQP